MGRFAGKVGFVTYTETSPGVWEEVTTEKQYYGDLLRNTRRYEGTNMNKDLTINNEVSILCDAYAYANFPYCKYVTLNGVKWTVTNITIDRPRMQLTLGGIYHAGSNTSNQ